mmetsp:Transcript_11564/g.14353  ORF Transcript_11564/g.14353 Transcript_11564/m.14353 type:complete len:184 (-) Transcript_11564:1003-1554(-)
MDCITFLRFVGQLKTNKRTGWVYNDVDKPESIADHMYRMAVMTCLVKDSSLDSAKCVKMAIVHDMAECIVGDIAPADNIPKAEKMRRETEAMDHLCSLIEDTPAATEFKALFDEYNEQKTPEAQFVKDLDRLEMIIQAAEYEDSQNKNLQEFFNSTKGLIRHPEVKEWDKSLREQQANKNKSS